MATLSNCSPVRGATAATVSVGIPCALTATTSSCKRSGRRCAAATTFTAGLPCVPAAAIFFCGRRACRGSSRRCAAAAIAAGLFCSFRAATFVAVDAYAGPTSGGHCSRLHPCAREATAQCHCWQGHCDGYACDRSRSCLRDHGDKRGFRAHGSGSCPVAA